MEYNAKIEKLQHRLQDELGIDVGEKGCDGKYWTDSENAANMAIDELLVRRNFGGEIPVPEPIPEPIPGPVAYEYVQDVDYGDRGELVRQVQEQMFVWGFNIEIDGIFGKITRRLVKEFQRSMNVNSGSGIVDKKTWNTIMQEPLDTSSFPEASAKCKCNYSDCAALGHLPKDAVVPQALRILYVNLNAQVKIWYGPSAYITLRSVYRCVKHNTDVGGAGGSSHLRVKAFDYRVVINGIVQKNQTFNRELQRKVYEWNPYGGRSLNYNTNGHVDLESPRTW